MSYNDIFFSSSTRREKARAKSAENWRGRPKIPHVMLHGIEHKSCSTCAALKPLSEFNHLTATIDQLDRNCKDCSRELNRKKYGRKKNKEEKEGENVRERRERESREKATNPSGAPE